MEVRLVSNRVHGNKFVCLIIKQGRMSDSIITQRNYRGLKLESSGKMHYQTQNNSESDQNFKCLLQI